MKSGITQRWLRGSLAVTVLVVAVAEALFLYLFTQSYYGSVRQSMVTRFSSMSGQLKMYTGETAEETAQLRSLALRRMVEQFGEKDKYEFMLLDAYGNVIASSSGTSAAGILTDADLRDARKNGSGTGSASYRTETGERVMSVCMIVPYAAGDVAVLRLVTSLTLVDQQMRQFVVLSLLVAAAILIFSVRSVLYFVRSIVRPLGEMEKTAASIAAGDLSVRLTARGDPQDEVDRLNISINRMAEGLAETEQIKNEFISSVSHELRTPLTSIKGWVETMQAIDDPTDENYRKGLAIIGSEAGRLYNMVEELLDFSRLQNGHMTVQRQPLDLVAETTDAVLFLEPRCEQGGLILDYSEPEQMIPVLGDPDRLRQVFINVMDNAVKYSVPGGRITVKVWAGRKKAFVEVIDQGRGIPPEDLENVKTKFYKGRNAVRGSGIGLALVDELMDAMDGSLDIHSTLGRGTVVTLGLPLYRPEKKPGEKTA